MGDDPDQDGSPTGPERTGRFCAHAGVHPLQVGVDGSVREGQHEDAVGEAQAPDSRAHKRTDDPVDRGEPDDEHNRWDGDGEDGEKIECPLPSREPQVHEHHGRKKEQQHQCERQKREQERVADAFEEHPVAACVLWIEQCEPVAEAVAARGLAKREFEHRHERDQE